MASAPQRRIVVVGAGISGLTLALSLAKFGASVLVLERNEEIQEAGAGLQISPNARRALNALGLDAALRKVSFEPEGIHVYPFRRPRPLTTLALGAAVHERFGVAYAVMHRADLAQTLYAACRKFANIEIRFGIEHVSVSEHERPSLTYAAAGDEPRTEHPFAVVGADGVSSRIRTAVLGGGEAAYSGYAAWRTLIPSSHLGAAFSTDHTSLMWGAGFHAVAYPVPHRDLVNIALFTRENLSLAFGLRPKPNLPARAARDPRFAAMLAHSGEWTHWPLASVSTPDWHRGSIGLIGDAAHAMLPFQAQGAAMGIEDAVTLAPLLVSEESAKHAFARYESIRQPRVRRVAAISVSNGRAFHMPPPLSHGRDLVVRMQGPTGHFRRLEWLYGHDPLANQE